jgi:hypothetical protein
MNQDEEKMEIQVTFYTENNKYHENRVQPWQDLAGINLLNAISHMLAWKNLCRENKMN